MTKNQMKHSEVTTPEQALQVELTAAGFKFAVAEKIGEREALGYQHADGRAALLIQGCDEWTVSGIKNGGSSGQGVESLRAILAHMAEVPKVVTPHTADALIKLGYATAWKFDLRALAGDDNYQKRLKLAKALHGSTTTRVKDTTVKALTTSFAEVVGHAVYSAEAMKRVAYDAANAKKAATKAEAEFVRKELARTAVERSVPGNIVPILPKKSKAVERAERETLRKELTAKRSAIVPPAWSPVQSPVLAIAEPHRLYETATGARVGHTGELAVLSADAARTPVEHAECLIPTETALLEHIDTGVVLLRLSAPGLHGGAPCVYNDGSRVALGVVSLVTLTKFRKIEGADIKVAAAQLLAPIVASVTVTQAAERHLRAVIECKEIITMATKKFEAPEGTVTKKSVAKKPVTKKAGAKKAAKETSAPRKSSMFRLRNETAKEWGAFTGQKKTIVDTFKKLGAVGAKAAGVTRAALIDAMPDVPASNISFYLSKWQAPNYIEKLAAAE